ncbi:MAG: hypothetical protein J3Q66DRAFT_353780 [Benniella sp.]|nr:MAG: hypothetical protein J3Q66DRAFT_353780 [Benniella sp.]
MDCYLSSANTVHRCNSDTLFILSSVTYHSMVAAAFCNSAWLLQDPLCQSPSLSAMTGLGNHLLLRCLSFLQSLFVAVLHCGLLLLPPLSPRFPCEPSDGIPLLSRDRPMPFTLDDPSCKGSHAHRRVLPSIMAASYPVVLSVRLNSLTSMFFLPQMVP